MAKDDAKETLRLMINPDGTVYTILRHTCKNGSHISVLIVRDGRIQDISYLVAEVLNTELADDGGVKYRGNGDRLVDELGLVLHRSFDLEHVWL